MKLNDEQIEYVTDVMHSTIMDISNETGFKPEHEDIIKCLNYALKSLWFFPLAIYIHLGIVGLMKDSFPSLFIPFFMTYQLTPTQERVLNSISKSECRSRDQMLSMIMQEGLSWMYTDKSTYLGDVCGDTEYNEELMKEIEGFHAIWFSPPAHAWVGWGIHIPYLSLSNEVQI